MWDPDRLPTDVVRLHRVAAGVGVRLARLDRDPASSLTRLAAVGLAVAAGLAVFGLPPVSLHSPTHFVGIMDPLCGMTRGVVATLRADLREAWGYNPASPLVVVAGLGIVARWVMGSVTGVWVTVRLRVTRLVVAAVGLSLAALQVNQQLHAARLR